MASISTLFPYCKPVDLKHFGLRNSYIKKQIEEPKELLLTWVILIDVDYIVN